MDGAGPHGAVPLLVDLLAFADWLMGGSEGSLSSVVLKLAHAHLCLWGEAETGRPLWVQGQASPYRRIPG